MKTAPAKTALVPARAPKGLPPLALAFCLALLLACLSALPRVRTNLRLAGSFWIASAILLVLSFVLWRQTARNGRKLELQFKPVRVHYIQLSLQLSLYVYWGWYWHEVSRSALLIAAQLVFLYALDMLVCWWRRDTWVLGFGPFPIVLSTNVFLWFHDDWFFLQFLLVSTGVLCKEFVKWERDGRRTHIFNPSAIALFLFSVALLATHSTAITWGEEIATTFQRPPNIYVQIFILGIIVQALFSVTLVTLSAAAVLYVLNLAYTQATGVYWFVDSNIPAAVFLGVHLLVTDPATSPKKPLGKVVFGGLYGAAVFGLYGALTWAGAPGFYDKLLCVPVLNLMVRALDRWAARFRPLEWASSWSPRQFNFAHMGIWTALFVVMLATGFVGPTHPGRDSEFWRRACQEGKFGACKTWEQTLEMNCRGSSSDCLSRATGFYRLFNLAKDRADKGRPDEAIPLFEKSLELNPESVRADTNLANALARRGRFDEAIAHYRKALARNPQHIEAQTNLGVALANQGKLDEAIALYERVLEMEPRYIEAHADLGVALSRQGKTDEATVHFEKALAIKPDFAQAHTNLGVVLIQKGMLDAAIGHFEAALRTDPANGEAQANLGMLLLQKGKLEEAVPHLERAVAAAPDNPELRTNLGGALAETGRLDDAIAQFEKAVALSPASPSLLGNLAAALAEKGKPEEAAAQLEKAVALAPESPDLRATLAAGLARYGRWKEAAAQFEKALALAPASPAIHTNFGAALLEHGRTEDAIFHLERALALAPASAEAHYYLGRALRSQGRTADALEHWRQALQAQPDLLAALDQAAWVMATSREPSVRNGAAAVELAEHALQVSGGRQPEILVTLAASYAEAGEFPKAVETAHQALHLASLQNDRRLADGVTGMVALYQARTPFRDVR